MKYPLPLLPKIAASKRGAFKKELKKLKRQPAKETDTLIHGLHQKAFEHIDCMACANCCKTTGPLWTPTDIRRIAKHEGLKEREFKKNYLRLDEDGDWVLQSVPCPFLLEDNACSIYEVRPKACREYPHTDMVGQQKIFDLTIKNSAVCPAVMEILEKITP